MQARFPNRECKNQNPTLLDQAFVEAIKSQLTPG
jgi:hypothetical protein